MKRVLSLLLTLVMVFSLIPVAAFADSNAAISFETTFAETMTIGDTFTVTANLANNPGMATMTVSLKWNEDAVKFNGFETEYDEDMEEDVLVTDVFKSVWEPVVNYDLGIITASRTKNTTKSGTLFVANFEIVGSGDLEIALKDADATEFEMANADMEDIAVTFDYSDIENLSVAAPEPEGPEIPTGAPFSAITTDVGPIVDITKESEVEVSVWGSGHPAMLYHVVLPEDAEYADVTMNIPLSGFTCDSDGNVSNYFGPVYGGEGGGSSFETVAFTATTTTIRVPMEVVDTWGTSEAYSLLKNEDGDYYVAGPQDASFSAICYFSFEYGKAGGEEEEIYSITIDENMVGGTLTAYNENQEEITEAKAGDYVFVTITPAEGYKGNSYTINGELANDVIFQMPEEDVILSATFTPIHTCSYTESDVDAKYLKSEATCQSGAVYYKSCTCGEFATTAETFVSGDPVDCVYVNGACKWCSAAEPVQNPGYRFATSADVSAENGGNAVVHLKITGHSDPTITTYNAYDLTLTYDNTKLEFVSGEGADSGDQIKIEKKGENQIQIVGVGDTKTFDVEVAKLTFKTLAEGVANITINKVQVSEKKETVSQDIPLAIPQHKEDDTDADETPDVSLVIVPFSVSKPDYINGASIVLPCETYEFSFKDTENYNYTNLSVTIGGVPVEDLTPNEEGKYIIENVNGSIVISATQTAKSYNVTVVNDGATVNAPETATYGEVYAFTVEASEGKDIDTVKVTKTDDAAAEISYTINENGEYEIAGTDITADFTINVTQKDEPVAATTTITFTGVEAAEVQGGLTQTATVGQEFSFRLNKVEGFTYTAKVGEIDLAETAATEMAPAFFTIPAKLVVEGGVTVTIAKTEIRNLKVEVSPYFNTDGATMFLVIAKDGEKVLSYSEEVMFYSSRYALSNEEAGAYCWLVSSSEVLNSAEAVKAAAEVAIKTADSTVEALSVAYDCDVNQTIKVDVNDAQLAYDMYKGEYLLSDSVTMDKFLEADMSTDKKLDVNDVAAIINIIVNGNNS